MAGSNRNNQNQQNQNKPADNKPPEDNAEVKALMEKLEAAEARAQAAEQERDAALTDRSGLKVAASDQAHTGDHGGYNFSVGPRSAKLRESLPAKQILACDESEAKRFYCYTTEYPPGSGLRVDPVKVVLDVVCLDRGKRNEVANHRKKLSAIRKKLDAGVLLSEAEKELYEAHEAEILQLEKETTGS